MFHVNLPQTLPFLASSGSQVNFSSWGVLLISFTKIYWEHITGEGNTLETQNKESQTHWYNTEPLAMVWVKVVTGPKMPAWICN